MSKVVNKAKVSFEKLCEELNALKYEYVWEYIESVDKCTYFKTQWEEYCICVCFFVSGDAVKMNYVECDDMSAFVMETVEKEIRGAIEKSLVLNEKEAVA